MKSRPSAPRRLAVVLSGGGARGAYEVGVLSNLLPRMAALGIKTDILVATSVGALNACALAATAHFPGVAGARLRAALLRRSWEAIESERVFIPSYFSAFISLPLHLANLHGPHPEALITGPRSIRSRMTAAFSRRAYSFRALYDTTPLQKTLRDGMLIDWEQLQENLIAGHPAALAISATSIQTGETVVFTQANQLTSPRLVPDEHLRLLPVRIDHQHALASAAIPFLFPPVRIGLPPDGHHSLFMDGGIRQNTPLLPAILLGADSILVIGLHSRSPEPPIEEEQEAFEVIPILGKILNAFFLDRVRTDFDRLSIMNKLIENAQPDRLAALNARRLRRGKDPLREIRALEVTPSRDIGQVTAELWEHNRALHRPPWRWLFDARDLHGPAFGDLLSYVFFHPEFARCLIKLGEEDAAREVSEAHLRWMGGLPGGERPGDDP